MCFLSVFEQITHIQPHIEKKLLELATSFLFYLIGNFLRNKIGLMYFFCKISSNRDNCKKLIFYGKSVTLLESGNPKIWLERIFFIFTSKRTNPKNLLLVSQKNPNSPNYKELMEITLYNLRS